MQRLTDAEGVGLGPEAVARAGVGAPTALRIVLTIVGACAYCRCPDQPVTCRLQGASHAAALLLTASRPFQKWHQLKAGGTSQDATAKPHALLLAPTLAHATSC